MSEKLDKESGGDRAVVLGCSWLVILVVVAFVFTASLRISAWLVSVWAEIIGHTPALILVAVVLVLAVTWCWKVKRRVIEANKKIKESEEDD